MSNTTALESWGASKGSSEAADEGEYAVAEHDITGDGDEHDDAGDESLVDDGEVQDADAEAASRAAKMKKDMRTLMIAGIAAAVLIAGIVGFAIMKRRAASQQAQQEVSQQEAPRQSQGDDTQGQVIAPVAQRQEAPGAIIAEHADGTPVTPSAIAAPAAAPQVPDFGLQSQAPIAPTPIQAAAPAPMAQTTPVGLPMPAPVISAPLTAAPLTAEPLPAASPAQQVVAPSVSAELDKLRVELAALRSDLNEKTQALEGVRNELNGLKKAPAPRAAPAKVAPPKVVAKKVAVVAKPAAPSTGITETVIATAPVSVPTPAATATAKSKATRSDYRIYAVIDGRVFVMGPDGETSQIAARSPLADGSRVTSIDADKNIVYTTAGEIR